MIKGVGKAHAVDRALPAGRTGTSPGLATLIQGVLGH
jgi:hypothetical protein